MQKTRYNQHTSISIGGRPIYNLRFVDDIDLMGGSYGEPQDLTNRLINRAKAYGTDVNTKRAKS